MRGSLGLSGSFVLAKIGRVLDTLVMGITIAGSIEISYVTVVLATWTITAISRAVLPSTLAPSPFDVRSWPKMMHSLHRPTSIHNFWSKRWHAMPRRNNVHLGYRPTAGLTRIVGGGHNLQTLAGAFGAFCVSGILHETSECFGKTA